MLFRQVHTQCSNLEQQKKETDHLHSILPIEWIHMQL